MAAEQKRLDYVSPTTQLPERDRHDLRRSAILFTGTALVLMAVPFLFHGVMPRDAVEPQKITFGSAMLLAFCLLAGFVVSAASAMTGAKAIARHDWIALALSAPAPGLAAGFLIFLWSR